MKIAIPSSGTVIDEHFGHCEYFTILTADEDNKILSEETLAPPPGCGCKSNIVPQLAEMGVTVMLAGGIGQGAVNILSQHGINTVRGCSGNVREVAEAWLNGNVADSGSTCQSHEQGDCPGH